MGTIGVGTEGGVETGGGAGTKGAVEAGGKAGATSRVSTEGVGTEEVGTKGVVERRGRDIELKEGGTDGTEVGTEKN